MLFVCTGHSWYQGNLQGTLVPLLVPGEPARDLGTKTLGTLVRRRFEPSSPCEKVLPAKVKPWQEDLTLAGRLV